MSSPGRIESLFHDALALPDAHGREAWLDAQCDGDADLRREVLSLLEAHYAMAAHSLPRAAEPQPGIPSASFGPYRAAGLLGRGGMSAVYRAHRADGQFEQTVALKIMAGHLGGPEFLRRFEIERQMLATLNHPHITHLLDGGVSSAGEPYLITEYVDGLAIDRYCDGRKLDVPARLEIFLQVCEAVDYAHRNLIVHRDLKPANILVNTDGAVKLLDFGTASLLAGGSEATVTRARMLTPRYASPEQLRGERVNIATDVFSLGVVLYELLCGAWPFGDPGSVLSELSRATGSAQASPPATAVTEESAEQRSAPREQLRRILDGDLSAIVLKALENDPARRYESVRQFATDITNFLHGLPVSARRQTALYRAGKFLGRHRSLVAAAVVFVLGLSGATLAALRQTRIAEARYSDLRALTTTLLFELKDAINDVPGSTPAQKILVTRVVKSLDNMERQSTQDPKLQMDLAEAYRQLAELQASPYVQNLGDTAGALANLAKARSLAAQQLAADPNGVAPLHTAAVVEGTAGEVYFGMGRGQDAANRLLAGTDFAEKALRASGAVPDLMEGAIIHQVLGDVLGQPGTASLNRPAEAATHYRRSAELDQMMVRRDPTLVRARRGIAISHLKLGDLVRFDDPETALDEYRQAVATFDSLPAEELRRLPNLRFRVQFLRKIGETLRDLGQWSEAKPYLDQCLAFFEEGLVADPTDKRAKYDLVIVLESMLDFYDLHGDPSGARPVAERTVALMDDLIRTDPTNQSWRMSRGYYRYKLATELARLGDGGGAASIGAAGLSELAQISDASDATPQELQLTSEAFARIEPRALRNRARAVRYAERYQKHRPLNDASGFYRLAIAQSTDGNDQEAAVTARRALALLPRPRNGRVYYIRAELEAIR